jgi:hypothetical protein
MQVEVNIYSRFIGGSGVQFGVVGVEVGGGALVTHYCS